MLWFAWSAATLNAIYQANQSANFPFKLEIVLKLPHLLGPLEHTTNSCTLNHPISDHEVNARPWRHYPNMGSYLHPNMVKNANFRGLRRIWEFLPTLRDVIILPPSQPRFLARLPRWQLLSVLILFCMLRQAFYENRPFVLWQHFTSTTRIL